MNLKDASSSVAKEDQCMCKVGGQAWQEATSESCNGGSGGPVTLMAAPACGKYMPDLFASIDLGNGDSLLLPSKISSVKCGSVKEDVVKEDGRNN